MYSLFASVEAEPVKAGLLESLGIDIQLLAVQTVAFLILLWALSKFVYPALSDMLEKREKTINDGIKAAVESEKKAEEAKAEIDELLNNARKHAGEIVSLAKAEATTIVEDASEEATLKAERMIDKAKDDISKEIEVVKAGLKAETMDLVAEATRRVVGLTVTEPINEKIVSKTIEDLN